MGRKFKYENLERYLKNTNLETIKLNFSEIENMSGPLLSSAYNYPVACWNNGGHNSFSKSWFNAGYDARVNVDEKYVIFTKKSSTITESTPKNHRSRTSITNKTECIDLSSLIVSLRMYHYDTVSDESSRYHSWISCYNNFQKCWQDESKVDFLSLQLAWYLASWGMLRNSFLFKHDYSIHRNVLTQLCSPKFSDLFDCPESINISLVNDAANIIKTGYGDNKVTDTLVTKILLGIFACTPAFDRYFKDSVRKYNVCSGNFNVESLSDLWEFYKENSDVFKSLQSEFKNNGVYYPPMKLLDMCFWQLGITNKNDES